MALTRTKFNEVIERDDEIGMHAIGRALVHLFNRQTDDEKQESTTKHHNLKGFPGADGRRGVITAKYYLKHRKLLDWQVEYWLDRNRRGTTRLGKYYRQIAQEAAKKGK